MVKGDVCIVASVARYSNQVVDVAEAAADEGMRVIAITDRASSPSVAFASASLFSTHQSSFISTSITSFFAVAECLINATATSKKSNKSLTKRQKMIKQPGFVRPVALQDSVYPDRGAIRT